MEMRGQLLQIIPKSLQEDEEGIREVSTDLAGAKEASFSKYKNEKE